MMPVINQSID